MYLVSRTTKEIVKLRDVWVAEDHGFKIMHDGGNSALNPSVLATYPNETEARQQISAMVRALQSGESVYCLK